MTKFVEVKLNISSDTFGPEGGGNSRPAVMSKQSSRNPGQTKGGVVQMTISGFWPYPPSCLGPDGPARLAG